jgi:hypothetical protein
MDPHEVLNPQSLADECELTLGRIHQLIRAGTIRATRLGKWTYVITRQEAERFKGERQKETSRSSNGRRERFGACIVERTDVYVFRGRPPSTG